MTNMTNNAGNGLAKSKGHGAPDAKALS